MGILAAAGSGERLGAAEPKAFVACGDRPLGEWSLVPLRAACDRVVVVVPPGAGQPPGALGGGEHVAGGAARSESVLAGVRAAPEAETYVVQDAARPLLTIDLVERCLAELEHGCDGAVAAAPMADTVKEADADGTVVSTLDRGRLWSIQTPQAFRAAALRGALDTAGDRLATATDDAALVEAAGGTIRVVAASPDNIKVTRPSDLLVAEALLRHRERAVSGSG